MVASALLAAAEIDPCASKQIADSARGKFRVLQRSAAQISRFCTLVAARSLGCVGLPR